MKKAIIIGSGIGGISTALRLKARGFDVDVFEKNSFPGGKLSNIDAVKNFAYKSRAHSDIIKKTKQRNWYSEDMFTRFIITDKVDKYYK